MSYQPGQPGQYPQPGQPGQPGPYPQPGQPGPYPQSGPPPQQNVVIVNTAGYQVYNPYNTKLAKIFGIGQIVCGCVIVAAYIAIIAVVVNSGARVNTGGYLGFWAPILFAIAGGFGVQSSKTRSRCTITTTMVLSIIGAIPSGILTLQTILSVAGFSMVGGLSGIGHFLVACIVITMIAAIVEFICALGASILCCRGACCGTAGPPDSVTGGGMILQQGNPYTPGVPQPAQPQGMPSEAAPQYEQKPPYTHYGY